MGAGAQPPKPVAEEGQIEKGARSEGESPANSEEESSFKNERGYTSDSELAKSPKHGSARPQSPVIVPAAGSANGGGWILVSQKVLEEKWNSYYFGKILGISNSF